MDFTLKRKDMNEGKKDISVSEEAFAIIQCVNGLTEAIDNLRHELRRRK